MPNELLEALPLAMNMFPRQAVLQEHCAKALMVITYGGDAAGRARKGRAADAGAIDACAACALVFSAEATSTGREAVRALVALLAGLDHLSKARQHRAAEAGVLRLIVASLERESAGANMGFRALRYRAIRNLTRSNEALQHAAMNAGARPEWL